MNGFKITQDSLHIIEHTLTNLIVNSNTCLKGFSQDLFATDYVLKLVAEGMPFRDAYRFVADHPNKVPTEDPSENIMKKKQQGATGNLGLEDAIKQIDCYESWMRKTRNMQEQSFVKLLEE
jgi:argininosuccinate lyase